MAVIETRLDPPRNRQAPLNGTPIAKPVPPSTILLRENESLGSAIPKSISKELLILRPRFSVRLWRALRKLVRKRQESSAVWDARTKAAQARKEHLTKQRELEQEAINRNKEIEILKEQLRYRDRDLAVLNDSEIPRLKNQIEVLEDEVRLLAAKHERQLAREKDEIAVHNQRMAGSDAENWQRRMME